MVAKFNPQTNRFENTNPFFDLTPEQQRLAHARFTQLLADGIPIETARVRARNEIVAENPSPTAGGNTPQGRETELLADAVMKRSTELVAQKKITVQQADRQAQQEVNWAVSKRGAAYVQGYVAGRNPLVVANSQPSGASGGDTENQGPTNRNSPRATTTTAPGSGRQSPTTTVPRNVTPTTTSRVTPTTTPRVTPTTTPRVTPTTTPRVTPTTTPRVSPTTTVPTNSTPPTTVAPGGTPPATPADPLLQAFTDWQAGNTLTPAQSSALSALGIGGSGGSGGGSGGPSTAQKKASAKIQTQAGKKAQSQYNAMAQSGFNAAQLASQGFYKTQAEQANTSIDAATKAYLEKLINPTAYSNAAFLQLTPQQQGLMGSLQAYGATGQQAQQQQTQDAEFNKFLTQLLTTSAQSLQTADKGYFDAMRNAGTAGQAAARLGVTQNTTAMQNQSTAQAEAIRQQLIQAGIQALMAGQANAANTLAS